jgi:hypothetical protein
VTIIQRYTDELEILDRYIITGKAVIADTIELETGILLENKQINLSEFILHNS